jgi:hypothetical protein
MEFLIEMKKVTNLLKLKVAQNVTISLGYSLASKSNPIGEKNHPIWSH